LTVDRQIEYMIPRCTWIYHP